MISFIPENAPACVAGVLALICLTVWPLFRTRRSILIVQLGAGVCFMAHYAFLGLLSPSLVNLLGSVQTLAALYSVRHARLNQIGYGLIPLMAMVGVICWTGPVSGLSVIAMVLIAFGRMQTNEWALRLLILAGGVFWIAHDFLVQSWIALTADILSLTTGLAMLVIFAHSTRSASLARTLPRCTVGQTT